MSAQTDPSGLARALELVGDRWSLLVVDALLDGPRRFGELQSGIEGIAPNILSQRLKHLEREGVAVARPYSERPVRLEYALTEVGRELAGALKLLAQWGARGSAQGLRHSLCGTFVDARWWCPTCARALEDPETDEFERL